MEYPVFELSYLGSNTLIAIIAIIHVVISHGGAVGGSIFLVWTEYLAYKRGDRDMDDYARRFLSVILIVTTTVGALTGVGIWFAVATGQPASIGSLLRVFFWAWFTEWIAFIAEVVLLIIYYYTWRPVGHAKKRRHIFIGVSYAAAAWVSMFIITGVLAAMLTPGNWLVTRSFWDAFVNPTWLPSLFFRTAVATGLAAGFALLFALFAVKGEDARRRLASYAGRWLLWSAAFIVPTGIWYLARVPEQARALLVWASGFINYNTFVLMNTAGALVIVLTALAAIRKKPRISGVMALIVILISSFYIGEMEMIREKIRKPYVVYGYMYANGIRVEDMARINKDGILNQAKWSTVKQVNGDNMLAAGREVYTLQCSSCHTLNGWNSRRDIVAITRGWPERAIDGYIANLNTFRYFMPPFCGTEAEREALSAWIYSLQKNERLVQK
jgi:mono/diheme cytochrome c family protein